jgi:hypothetical protein
MDAQTVNNLGGVCQILGVGLVLQEVLVLSRYRGELARGVARLRGWRDAAEVAVRRLLGLPRTTVREVGAEGDRPSGECQRSRLRLRPLSRMLLEAGEQPIHEALHPIKQIDRDRFRIPILPMGEFLR